MTEYNLDEVNAIVFDGTGWGEDGTIWGGELLAVSKNGYCRLGHLLPFSLPGGTSAITSPWRIALSFCDFLSIKECSQIFCQSEQTIEIVRTSLKKEINCPLTSSMGRLFDAASAILQIAPQKLSYEAEAAIKLETAAHKSKNSSTAFSYQVLYQDGKIIIDPREMMRELLQKIIFVDKSDAKKFLSLQEELAYRFHYTIACMVLDLSRFALKNNPTNMPKNIVLTGGVFQNKLLLKLSMEKLLDNGIFPLISLNYSPGDGQISLGQAMIARFSFN
jgi:hydrogenase maturation protein HypF